MRLHLRRLTPLVVLCSIAGAFAVTQAQRQTASPTAGLPPPIDPQRVQDQQKMTWADYRPIPGTNWASLTANTPGRAFKVALVAIDFEDQPFVITQPKHSDPFGNPQIDPIKRDAVAKFYTNFLGTPGPLNHGHTIHEYWMETSRGKIGIPKIDAFGPYRMPKKLFQYGLNEWGQEGACPTGYVCDGRMEPDADAIWAKDAGAEIKANYELVLRIYAGYDETTIWQEFGEMKFNSKEDIPAAWGNPDTTKPRWAPTRYVPWTSWRAGAQQWGLSSVRQGESSGTITHEIGHAAFNIGDNNNNPYVTPYRRVGSGTWDMMDRGGFNGPGGPHRRWVVPVQAGASMPAGLLLRNRIWSKFLTPEQVLRLNRDGLASSGLALATVVARSVEPGPNQFAGILVTLDGDAWQRPLGRGRGDAAPPAAAGADRTPPCDRNADPLCAGDPQFNNFSLEVVQRLGYDSFTPDNGVLIAKNKDRQNNSCGYGCHAWVIDAHPEDMNMVDFTRPGGTRVMRTVADYRQLNDALFHAGLRSGSQYEWEDTPNRLHFYVIDLQRAANGVLSYTIGVKSLDGAGPQARGVAATAPATASVTGSSGTVRVHVTNTGAAAPVPAGVHQSDAPAAFGSDVFRVTTSVEGQGWSANLQNALVALKFGAATDLPVYISRAAGGAASARVTVTVTSESDPGKRATVTIVASGGR